MKKDFKNNIDIIKKIYLALAFPRTAKNLAMDKILSRKRTPFPRIITMFITNKCNLSCDGCLNAAYRNKHIAEEQITLRHIKKILPELKKYKPMFYITGGEALINKHTFDIINLLSKNGIITAMSTNGFFLPENVENILNSGLNFLSVSLDHYDKEIHNKVKGNNTETFDRAVSGIKSLINKRNNLKKLSLNIKINTVIRKENYNELPKIYDFVENLGADELCIQHYSFYTAKMQKIIMRYMEKNNLGEYRDGVLIDKDYYLNSEQVEELKTGFKKIRNKVKTCKTKLSERPAINNLEKYYAGIFPNKNSFCSSPLNSLSILGNANVCLCFGNKMGNLNDNASLKNMWDSEKAREFQDRIAKDGFLPPCFGCHSLNYKYNN
ncbi:radical SAM protein [Candidatus Parcubacteria bacterium]|nr:radical SAM protein [Candidatus Parcubacteria bacterium]